MVLLHEEGHVDGPGPGVWTNLASALSIKAPETAKSETQLLIWYKGTPTMIIGSSWYIPIDLHSITQTNSLVCTSPVCYRLELVLVEWVILGMDVFPGGQVLVVYRSMSYIHILSRLPAARRVYLS